MYSVLPSFSFCRSLVWNFMCFNDRLLVAKYSLREEASFVCYSVYFIAKNLPGKITHMLFCLKWQLCRFEMVGMLS